MNRIARDVQQCRLMNRARELLAGFALIFIASAASAQSQTPSNVYDYVRASGFTYYGAGDGALAGLLKSETVEPGRADLCVTTTYAYDGTGNKTSATTSKCVGASGTASFATRASNSSYASQTVSVAGVSVTVPAGTFVDTLTNAKSQSETHQTDPRFGVVISLTGPNQLSTSWQLDDFGRKVQESRADGTQTNTAYCYISGRGVDLGSNSTGSGPLASCIGLQSSLAPNEIPGDAVMFVYSASFKSGAQLGPASRVYMDRAGRKLRTVSEGFDGKVQPSNATLVAQDITYTSQGVQSTTTQPYFLGTGTSTSTGSASYGFSRTEVDALGRPVKVYVRDDNGTQTIGGGRAALTTISYVGLSVRTTNDAAQTRLEEKSIAGQVVLVTDSLGAQVAHDFDAFGNLLSTRDALQNTVTMSYDYRGRKLSMADPDAGLVTYSYDALGQLKAQQNAKQRAVSATTQTTMDYDVLGRMTQRIDAGESTSTWSYDTYADGSKCSGATYSYGKLCESVSDTGVRRRNVYDSLLRPLGSRTDITGGPSTTSAVSYDANGRLDTQTYPTGLQLKYNYTDKGFLKNLQTLTALTLTPLPATALGIPAPNTTLAANSNLWAAVSYNAWGQAEQYTYGNGAINKAEVDPVTGRVQTLKAGLNSGAELLDLRYAWNNLGQVTSRTDANGAGDAVAVTDSLRYDDLGRLKGYDVSGNSMLGLSRTVELRYNAAGMLLYKSDVGSYSYGVQGRPHALQSVTSNTAGVASASYAYDENGNLTNNLSTAGAGKYRNITYTSFNLPTGQSGLQGPIGGSNYAWAYDENHQRIKEVRTTTEAGGTSTRTTWMLHPDNAGGLGFESETTVSAAGSTTSNRHYISVGGASIAVVVSTGNLPSLSTGQLTPAALSIIATVVKVEYWHKDQLGSLIATSDHRGLITARYSYDPFGKRRQASGAYDANGVLVYNWTTDTNNGGNRGYTGHEHLDDVGLIHMNGRIYDPTLGRFLQADPFIQDPGNLQNYDRYGYCFNNPITCSDPSGLSFFSPTSAFNRFFGYSLGDPLIYYTNSAIAHTKVGYQLGSIAIGVVSSYYCSAAAYICNGIGQAAWAAMAGYSAEASIKTGLMAAASTYVNGQIHTTFDVSKGMAFSNTLAHGVWGCAEAKLGGGSCGSGFRGGLAGAALSNYGSAIGLGEYGGPQKNLGDRVGNTMIHALTGGVASVAGGGNFWDGARSSAMAYLFNELLAMHDETPAGRRRALYLSGYATLDESSNNRIWSLDPSGADPWLKLDVVTAFNMAEAFGDDGLRIAQGYRTNAEQDALYAQGRTAPGNIVTYAKGGESNHNPGFAIDLFQIVDGRLYNPPTSTVKIFKILGFEWGGDWRGKKADPPHFQRVPK